MPHTCPPPEQTNGEPKTLPGLPRGFPEASSADNSSNKIYVFCQDLVTLKEWRRVGEDNVAQSHAEHMRGIDLQVVWRTDKFDIIIAKPKYTMS